jgi:hypothetical protein
MRRTALVGSTGHTNTAGLIGKSYSRVCAERAISIFDV